MIHWHSKFKSKSNAGIAYVTLGRSRELNDIFIKGDLEREGIHASPEALKETYRLQSIFDEKVERLNERAAQFWTISYLNVSSLRCHEDDVKRDNLMMSADIFSLGETWLEPGEQKCFDGYTGTFANHGKGKGVAAFYKTKCVQLNSVTSTKYSGIHLRNDKFDSIFLYLSSGCNKEQIFNLLESWIDNSRPTTIMGDLNIDFDKNDKFVKSLESIGFEQLIQDSTCITGSLIDHIYVNIALKSLNVITKRTSVYYSDHDVITLNIPK